ncbi:hypothetical protein PV327_002900 [Microctonus hyperodae]|uniref:Translation initiation factor eIF2B subunit beta n=1 Tax=Microctonus hyperodae TaxID=165561 RepID=A0AA39FGH2_MICHY|nr:hypothetical protein PV327_002900 [Microctonus hyperodae]
MVERFLSIGADVKKHLLEIIRDINYGKLEGTYNVVVATIKVLKEIINSTEWTTAKELIEVITLSGKYLIEAIPLEASIGNMVRRILQIIREEYRSELKNKPQETNPQESLHKILTSNGDQVIDFNIKVPTLKSALIEHINEFEVEIETCSENVIEQASEHIHTNEIIMTLGRSKLVEEFFKKASETRAFEVIVAEGAPFLSGHEMVGNLSKSKIKTTLISDVAIFAMMSRVNKVIIGINAVMADGGLKAISGAHAVAQAAKHYSVPVMVLMPLYKLSPLYHCAWKQDTFNKHIAPIQGVIDGANASLMTKIQSYNPVFDYVPSELVTLFITNTGGNAPSYIYRLLKELYDTADYEL